MPNLVLIPMDDEMPGFGELDRVCARGNLLWWLWMGECRFCSQRWLVAQEERVNDVVAMRRLSAGEADSILRQDLWPGDFDSYERLIRLSQTVQRFRYANPDEQLPHFVDLARERPGISVAELADLFNQDPDTACGIARRAVAESGVTIKFDC